MSWPIYLPVKYHIQDDREYCGPAVASMILSASFTDPRALNQDQLWNYIQTHDPDNPQWATDPQDLANTLTAKSLELGTPTRYVVNKPTDSVQGINNIVNTLYNLGKPVATLANDGGHWVVVNGVQTNIEPKEGNNWRIEGFWVRSPLTDTDKMEAPPPHADDDRCGTGGALGDDHQFWTNAEWPGRINGCYYDDNRHRQYISVCPAGSPAIIATAVSGDAAFVIQPTYSPEIGETLRPAEGTNILSPKQVIEFGKQGLRQYNLFQYGFVDAAFKNTIPGVPILVNEFNRLNTYYYLVPWEKDEAVIAYTKIDARFGFFQGLQVLHQPLPNAVISKEQALKLVLGKRFEIPNLTGRLMIFSETTNVLPLLAWRPCLESMSPYLPFYQITTGSTVIYIRVDGAIFTQLTPSAYGGYPADRVTSSFPKR